jgi:hypothetical protein
MVLPREYPTLETEVIQKKIAALTPEEFGALPPLLEKDLVFMGVFIQLYNTFDFNLRRALEIFLLAHMLPVHLERKYDKFRDNELTSAVSEVVANMAPALEDIALTTKRLAAVEEGRSFRNLIGHFAAKRFPGEPVYVFVGKNDRDAKSKLRGELRPHRAMTAVVLIEPFHEMTRTLVGIGDWFAPKIREWYQRYLPNYRDSEKT